MAQTPFQLMEWSQGLYTDVSPILVPENALHAMSNVNVTYKIGSILKRCGYEKIGSTIQTGKAITGLYNFRQSAATQKMLATVNNSGGTAMQLFYSTGGAWTELTDAETAWNGYEDAKVEMEAFIGYCFFVGYDPTDGVWLPIRSLTGTTFGTTNTTSMPSAKFIKRYRDRLYIANCYNSAAYPYRVFYSSVPVAGAITWTPASDYIDVDFSEEITGMGTNWDRLMIFTEYSAYMYDQEEWKQVWDVGCAAHRTIKNSAAYMIWANMDGVWISTGGRPENVAGRVIDFIRYTDMRNAFAEVVDEEYHLYLGSVTVNGIAYTNCSLIFNIPTKTWRVNEYANSMSALAKFYSSGDDFLYMGENSGSVFRLGKYTDSTLLKADDTTDITAYFQTGALSFGNPAIIKNLGRLIAYSERSQGLLLKSRVIDRNVVALSEFKKVGQLQKYINDFQINPNSGNLLQIEGVERGQNAYWSLFGITVNVDQEQPFKN